MNSFWQEVCWGAGGGVIVGFLGTVLWSVWLIFREHSNV